jgi:hypothetical protein
MLKALPLLTDANDDPRVVLHARLGGRISCGGLNACCVSENDVHIRTRAFEELESTCSARISARTHSPTFEEHC